MNPLEILKKKPTIILITILLLGLFLRVYCLDCESVWLDEGYSILWAKQEPSETIEAVSKDVHPPLYYLILHYWIGLFGDSEFVIRSLSVIFGFLAIYLIYRVGVLLFDRRTGILAALILSISVFHIHYSQEIRGYSLMVMLTLLSMYFFINLLKARRPTIQIAYILSSTLLIYTHFFGLFVILTQNLFFFGHYLTFSKNKRNGLRNWITLQIILFLIYLPWTGYLLRQAQIVQAGNFLGWISPPPILSIVASLFEYSGFYSIFAPLLTIAISGLLSIILIALLIYSFIDRKGIRACARKREHWLLLMWLIIPIITPFLLSFLLAPLYWTRFTSPASLAFYILVARGIQELKGKSLQRLTILLIVLLSLTSIWGYYITTDNEQWRETAGYIETNGFDGDLVMINTWYCHIPFDYYFNASGKIDREVFPRWDFIVDEENVKSLPDYVQDRKRIWLVLSHDGDPEGLIAESLLSLGYSEIESQDFRHIELYLFGK
jgi:uncharacterized membrane protein